MKRATVTIGGSLDRMTSVFGDHRVQVTARCIGALLFAVAMGIGAAIRIPLPYTPVPVTLQTFFLYSGALLLGRSYAVQMVAWYLGLGLAGLPMFASGVTGPAAFMGPTGGYLVGFLLAVPLIGYLSPRAGTWWRVAGLLAIASTLIYAAGVVWLARTLHLSVAEGLQMGCFPFLLGDGWKIIAATGVATLGRRFQKDFGP